MDYELKRDNRGRAYYLDYYFPKRMWNNCSEEDLEFTRNLLKYKDYTDRQIWADFTFELMEAAAIITNDSPGYIRQALLLAVPRSHPEKFNSMVKSIETIATLSKDGVARCDKPLVDAAELIIRTMPIGASHTRGLSTGKRHDIAAHINSMKLTSSDLSNDALYIVMDDITTTGDSLWACANILIMAGIRKDNIKFLTIGKTL